MVYQGLTGIAKKVWDSK